MSFFGFDTSLPKKGGAPDEESALNEKIERALASKEDVEVYTWGQDAYDGLGDQLQETNDDLNEDTFGAFAQEAGKDFDFGYGTAQTKTDRNASAFAASFDDFWSTPAVLPETQPPVPPQPQVQPQRPPDATRTKTLEEVEAELRAQRSRPPAPAPAPQPVSAPAPSARPLTLEEVEAELRGQRHAPAPSAPAPSAPASVAPRVSGPPPGMVRPPVPPPTAPVAPVHPSRMGAPASASNDVRSTVPPVVNPQAAHMARMRAMLEACPAQVQQTILSLPPPIQFESLEEIGARFPAVLQPGVSQSEEQAAIQLLLSSAPARMQQWQAAEEKRRAKAAKVANITRYNGLMSGSDKDFITRIQISHLVTPDPYADDFYAHVFFAVRGGGRRIPLPDASTVEAIEQHKNDDKKGTRRKLTRHENAMLRMQQQVERLVDNRKKREAKGNVSSLTGTLGRVSLSSANKPRQILQVIHNTTGPLEAQSDAKTGSAEDAMRAALQGASLDDASLRTHDTQKHKALTRREALAILEHLYAIVLRLEQMRREPALDADLDALREQKQLTDTLWSELRVLEPLEVSDPHPFVSLLNHVKGKRLLPRALRLLDAEQGLTTLTMLIASFSSLDAVRNYATWEQFQALDALPHARAPLSTSQAAEIGRSIEAFGNSVLFNMISLINQAPLRIVSGMLALLMERNDIVQCAKTRSGISLLTVLLSRAETLRQAASAPVPLADAAPSADEVQQWSNVFDVLLDRLAAHGQLAQLFPSTRVQRALPFGVDVYLANALRKDGARFDIDAEDEPVWNLMALFAIHSDLNQQQVLVQELREKILSTIIAANEAKSKGATREEDVRIRNVNLLLHALNLDAAQITL